MHSLSQLSLREFKTPLMKNIRAPTNPRKWRSRDAILEPEEAQDISASSR